MSAEPRCDALCSCLSGRISVFLKFCFARYGAFASKRPWASILVAVVFILICFPGFLLLRFESDQTDLNYVDGSITTLAALRHEESFPFNPGRSSVFVYFVAKDGKNLFSQRAVVDMGRAFDKVMALKTPEGHGVPDICEKSWRGRCEATSLLHEFQERAPALGVSLARPAAGEGEMESLAKQFWTFCDQQSFKCHKMVSSMDGYLTAVPSSRGGGGPLSLKSILLGIHLDPFAKDKDGKKSYKSFQTTVIEYMHAPSYDWTEDSLQTEDFYAINLSSESIASEGARPATAESHLMGIAFSLIVGFVCCSIYAPTRPRSRNLLAMSTMLIVGLALGCAIGLSAYCNVPMTSMTALVVFTLFGVSVDDIIVMVHAYDRIDSRPTLEDVGERVTASLETSGTAITLTSATSLVAFLCAANCPIGAIAYFCVSAAFGILSIYVLQITLFLPLFILDERRRLSSRRDCCLSCCLGAAPGEPGEPAAESPTAVNVITMPAVGGGCGVMDAFAKGVAYNRWIRLTIVGFFFLATALGAWGSANADSEADLTDYYVDSSYMKEYFRMHRKYWKAEGSLDVVYEHQDGDGLLSDDKRAAVQDLLDKILALDSTDGPVVNWLDDFDAWLSSSGATPSDLAATRAALQGDDKAFGAKVTEFLDAPPFKNSGKMILPWTQKKNVVLQGGVVKFSRFVMRYDTDLQVQATYTSNWKALYNVVYENFEDANLLEGRVPNTYVHSPVLNSADRDSKILSIILQNLAIACAAVAATVMIMLHPVIGLFVGLLVVSLDAMVVALLTLYGSKLDFVAFLCLSMTIGLVVDYATHTCHAYMHHEGSLDDKLYHCMRTMGASVLSGGCSTVLGIGVLAFASSKAFRLFFLVLGTAIVMGTLVGIAISPPLLRTLHGVWELIAGDLCRAHSGKDKALDEAQNVPSVKLGRQ